MSLSSAMAYFHKKGSAVSCLLRHPQLTFYTMDVVLAAAKAGTAMDGQAVGAVVPSG
jgi:hypothetical protein